MGPSIKIAAAKALRPGGLLSRRENRRQADRKKERPRRSEAARYERNRRDALPGTVVVRMPPAAMQAAMVADRTVVVRMRPAAVQPAMVLHLDHRGLRRVGRDDRRRKAERGRGGESKSKLLHGRF